MCFGICGAGLLQFPFHTPALPLSRSGLPPMPDATTQVLEEEIGPAVGTRPSGVHQGLLGTQALPSPVGGLSPCPEAEHHRHVQASHSFGATDLDAWPGAG